MLRAARRTRWLIALILLLSGQVGVVYAATAPTCTFAQESSGAPIDAAWRLLAPAGGAAADASHPAAPQSQPAAPTLAASCGATALGSNAVSLELPSAAAPSLSPGVEVLAPRLLVRAHFRPPRQG